MKGIAVALAGILLATMMHAQKEISIDSVGSHVGDSVIVCTKIYGGIYLDRQKGTPTLLNAGGAYPNAPLTIVIWAETRKSFKETPETLYKDKEICITGKVILYKDKPEIVVYDERQIEVK